METQELSIIDQVQKVAVQSGVPLEIDVTQLATLATRGKAITDVNDPNFFAVKKEMQKTRTELVAYFEDARKGFNALSKGVLEVQRIVLSEFVGEEDRLIALDKADKEQKLKEERLAGLPAKKERLALVGIEFSDEKILSMTDADFEIDFAQAITAKTILQQAATEAKLAEERAAFEAEKAEAKRKQDELDRIEAARVEERERAEKALQLQKETAEREAKEAGERRKAEAEESRLRLEREEQAYRGRIAREDAQRIEQIKADTARAAADLEAKRKAEMEAEAKRLADEKMQAFLKANNYNPQTDVMSPVVDGKFSVYRLVATYTE